MVISYCSNHKEKWYHSCLFDSLVQDQDKGEEGEDVTLDPTDIEMDIIV
jgi:hypothetical protein